MSENDFGPFNNFFGLKDCAILLRVYIKAEREDYAEALRKFNELGGYNAHGENLLRALAYREHAELHDYTCKTLEVIADRLLDNLTPEAFDEITAMFSDLDRFDRAKERRNIS